MSYLSISPKEATQASLSALASSNKALALVQPGAQSAQHLDGRPSAPTGVAGGATSGAVEHAFNAPPLIAPSSPSNRQKSLRSETAATWDEFPNGRFGDIRSPAYGEMDGYGASLKIPVSSEEGDVLSILLSSQSHHLCSLSKRFALGVTLSASMTFPQSLSDTSSGGWK